MDDGVGASDALAGSLLEDAPSGFDSAASFFSATALNIDAAADNGAAPVASFFSAALKRDDEEDVGARVVVDAPNMNFG
jgi:hypothetical protein